MQKNQSQWHYLRFSVYRHVHSARQELCFYSAFCKSSSVPSPETSQNRAGVNLGHHHRLFKSEQTDASVHASKPALSISHQSFHYGNDG